jgi:hypothetical protein
MASVQLLASTVKGPVLIQGWDDKLQGFWWVSHGRAKLAPGLSSCAKSIV